MSETQSYPDEVEATPQQVSKMASEIMEQTVRLHRNIVNQDCLIPEGLNVRITANDETSVFAVLDNGVMIKIPKNTQVCYLG